MSHRSEFKQGMKDGIPIALGYIAVSFTFGILAKEAGLSILHAVLISFTNLTSAGQFAGLGIITSSAAYLEMAFTQLVINLRYCLMSCALSQKLDPHASFIHRFFMSYGITDEIFGICSCKDAQLSPYYCYGAICVASPGWTLGTFLGALSGNILPQSILSALGVALYGMFIAVIIPPAKKDRIIAGIVLLSMILSLIFTWIPILNGISSGFRIIILTVGIASLAAILFPVHEAIPTDSSKE